jgi:sec-independent protein translocase protein TatC
MSEASSMTFWDHLDELRGVIIRMLLVTMLAAVVAFVIKDELFAVVLAPRTSDFITYRLLGVEPFSIHLMNTGLTEQFMMHLKTAMYVGVLVA